MKNNTQIIFSPPCNIHTSQPNEKVTFLARENQELADPSDMARWPDIAARHTAPEISDDITVLEGDFL
jgi:hypothetical protein